VVEALGPALTATARDNAERACHSLDHITGTGGLGNQKAREANGMRTPFTSLRALFTIPHDPRIHSFDADSEGTRCRMWPR
jgi:hypothetical protein